VRRLRDDVLVWVVDGLGAWLVEQLADAGRRKLTALVLGDEFERALREAGAAAVVAAAGELSRGDRERAEHLARVIRQVFTVRVPGAAAAGGNVLEMLHGGVAAQVGVLEDPGLTIWAGISPAVAVGIADGVIAPVLTRHLLSQIVCRAARGGPLAALAAQLNADVTHLQGQRAGRLLRQMGAEILSAIGPNPLAGADGLAAAMRAPECPPGLSCPGTCLPRPGISLAVVRSSASWPGWPGTQPARGLRW
jgi:hypothetical protein